MTKTEIDEMMRKGREARESKQELQESVRIRIISSLGFVLVMFVLLFLPAQDANKVSYDCRLSEVSSTMLVEVRDECRRLRKYKG